MDEPLSNLDARLRAEVRSQIKQIARQLKTTVVYVTHDQTEALALADEIALMRGGEIVQRGTPEDLYERSASREAAEFFGPMNFLEGEIVGDGLIRTEVGVLAASAAGTLRGRVLVGLRPERVRLNAPSEGGRNCFEATVVRRSFLGGRSVYEVQSKGTTFTAEVGATYREGDCVSVELPTEALRVFALEGRPSVGAYHH
jgi:ABC-type sugar transport system ATPase subunit